MNVHELRETDSRRFEREHDKWVASMDYDWWEPCVDGLKEHFRVEHGIDVDNIYFNLGYSQGDYAVVDWDMRLHKYMKQHGLDVEYPALYAAAVDLNCGVYVASVRSSSSIRVDIECPVGDSYPSGIFQHLEEEAWDELIEQQWDDADLEEHVSDFSKSLNDEAYKAIRAEYEYLTSDEQFIEWCEANDEEFDDEVSC